MSSDTKPIAPEAFSMAIRELTDDNLRSIRGQLLLSISKLSETNEMLKLEIENAGTSEEARADVALYTETIEENNDVIGNQRQRVDMLDAEYKRRGI
jgi:hypothetical protein